MSTLSRSTTRATPIPVTGGTIAADVTVPAAARGLILFAHGSGSSRFSPRNRAVAGVLQRAGFATVLADLLTEDEAEVDARTAVPRFDIGLLAGRVTDVLDWIEASPDLRELPVGLFGASTGAAAALVAAARRPQTVRAVVSRGGRPDLAGNALPHVRAATLLVVGGSDLQVLELNRLARDRLTGEAQVIVVPGATHLFEEPGALERVARLAGDWFSEHLEAEGVS